jgi:hypothetical protein
MFLKGLVIFTALVFGANYINELNEENGVTVIADTGSVTNEVADPHRWEREELLGSMRNLLKASHFQAAATGCLSVGAKKSLINSMRNGAMTKKECTAIHHDLVYLGQAVVYEYDMFLYDNYSESERSNWSEDMMAVAKFMFDDADSLANRLGMDLADKQAVLDSTFVKVKAAYKPK